MNAAEYIVQNEASRILNEVVIQDERLQLPPLLAEAARKVTFTGPDPKPFLPTPCKMTESSAALTGFVASWASLIASDRYGIPLQEAEVDTDRASLFFMSAMLSSVNGKPWFGNVDVSRQIDRWDKFESARPIRRQSTNIYKTKDGRFFHLHGSMNAYPTMKMVGVDPDLEVATDEAQQIYANAVGKMDAQVLDELANNKYRQAGTICYTIEDFQSSEQGQAMKDEPLYVFHKLTCSKTAWPVASTSSSDYLPLSGIKVLDVSRVIAAPAISKVLAILGAQVIRISNSANPDIGGLLLDLSCGKYDCDLNLKTPKGQALFANLVKDADVLIDGYRPGSLEKLGFSQMKLRELNPNIIIGRENCYGWKGPWKGRSGWQQISDCVTGVSWLQGNFLGLEEPVVPLLPNSDYQTGLVGAASIMHALYNRVHNSQTSLVEVSLTQFNIFYISLGQYTEEQRMAILARNSGLSLRHTDDMVSLTTKTLAACQRERPDLFKHPEWFVKMSGKKWGIPDFHILSAHWTMQTTKLGSRMDSSGPIGWAKPLWT